MKIPEKLKAIYQNPSLYGDSLLRILPGKLQELAWGRFCLGDDFRKNNDFEALEWTRINFFLWDCVKTTYSDRRMPIRTISKTYIIGNLRLLDSIEFISRRFLGTCILALYYLSILFPLLGFIIKSIHFNLK